MADAVQGFKEPTEKELEEIGREMDARHERVRQTRLAQTATDYAVAAHRWLTSRDYHWPPAGAPVRGVMDIIASDADLIHVKIWRALSGRDEDPTGQVWHSRVQNDWNGSAKVALIAMERSEGAWRAVAAARHDEPAIVLADSLVQLRTDT